jgi:carbamoyltransferase
VIEDGRVLAAVNEERLVRKKMVMGFPRQSIAAVLSLSNTRPEEVDFVAVGSRHGHFLNEYVSFDEGLFGVDRGVIKGLFFSIGAKLSFLREKVPALENLYYDLRKPVYAHREREIRRILKEEFGLLCPVEFIDHHFAHACSAYYSSGYQDALVTTMDGSGDGLSSLMFDVKDGRWHQLHQVRGFDSLGNYYAYITQICGFKAGKHEGKITGLAAHGKDRYREILSRFIEYRDGTMVNIGNTWYTEALKKLRAALPREFDKADLAATIQIMAEEITTRYIDYWRVKTNQRHVALAGGVFANVRINQRVHDLPGVESVFIHPAMSDEGLPLGAALAVAYQKSPDPSRLNRRCLNTVYLGPEFSDREIEKALDAEGIQHHAPDHCEEEIARLVAEGYVVARVTGRMEYGPRALGNRSILYRPDEPEVNDWLNKNLKRTEFMPFAPSTLYEDAERCYLNVEGARDAARFMTITFDCTPEMKKSCPGVVHVDGTARPQLVREQDNPSYYRIIKAFKERTGLPSIVNTSFNIHEEPIVCSPADAIRAFKEGHLDVLAIGRFIAMNSEAPSRVRERNEKRKLLTA